MEMWDVMFKQSDKKQRIMYVCVRVLVQIYV